MKKFKTILAVLLAVAMIFTLAACGGTNDEPTTDATTTEPTSSQESYDGEPVKVAAISGPTGMGMVNMMDKAKYDFTLTSDPTEIVAMISTGAVDIAACPLNLAANLYKKTNGGVKILGINTLGVLYVVTNGVTINSIGDLKGKTVYSTGEGATPEYILDYILQENGLEKDVTVEFLSEHSELATKLASGEVQIAVLPEPFVSVAQASNSSLTVALSLTDEWNAVNPDTELAMGCVIARSEFIDKNPKLVADFIADNKASVEAVNSDTVAASEKIVANKIIAGTIFAVDETQSQAKVNAAKLQKANAVISRCNIVFIDGEMLQTIANANFEVYFNADPTSVGGEVPPAGIYYAS